ncbi:MAG TPA: hypothetical protein VF669_11805 [Tepidisphaeraceae bacterium]|jgi:hypothetical protein
MSSTTPHLTLFEQYRVSSPAVSLHKHHTDTEALAAERMSHIAGELRRQVYQWITDAGENGLTDKELGRLLAAQRGLPLDDATSRYSAAPRRVELMDAGLVKNSGIRRERSIVWVKCDPPLDDLPAPGKVWEAASSPGDLGGAKLPDDTEVE